MTGPVIENWMIVERRLGPHVAPSQAGLCSQLVGLVYGHPSPYILEGELVTTSLIQSVDLAGRKVVTMNHDYHLGEPDAGYKEKFFDEFEKVAA